MEMTESEICFRFRKNGSYKKMIPILAQLNAVDDIDICKILERYNLLKERPKILHTYSYGV